MRLVLMIAVVVGAAGCGPATTQATPTDPATTAPSPSELSLETATCSEGTEVELPSAEVIREARANGTDLDAYGPTTLGDLLEGQATAAAEAAATGANDILTLKAEQWRRLADAFDGGEGSDRFHSVVGGMEVRAVRIADVWFISSETHAMPASFCEGAGDPEDMIEGPVALECETDLSEAGDLDYEAGAVGASDDPFDVASEWVDGNLARPSEVTLSHIAEEGGAVGDDVAVARDGRIIAVIDVIQADGWGLLAGSFTACPTELAPRRTP